MLKTAVGLILFFSPFLLLYTSRNKITAFFTIVAGVIGTNLLIATTTQFFHVFDYTTVLLCHLLIFLFVLSRLDPHSLPRKFKFEKSNFDGYLLFVILIALIDLYAIHYHYTGKYTLATTQQYLDIKNMRYPYPYFVDEWNAIAAIKYSIESKSLPLLSSFQVSFINYEFAFHSLLSEIMVLLNLNPVTQYTLLTIATGTLIVILIYGLQRITQISAPIAAISSLSMLYVTSGANLPGLWTLMPVTLGIISILLNLFFLETKDTRFIMLTAFLTLIFYPPLFPFLALSLIVFLCRASTMANEMKMNMIKNYFLLALGAGLLLMGIYVLSLGSVKEMIAHITTKLFYPTFTPEAIPRFILYYIIPIPILVFAAIAGVFQFKENLRIILLTVLGLGYWIVYSFLTTRIIIEYGRVVYFTSVLMMILSGSGMQFCLQSLTKINFMGQNMLLKYGPPVLLGLFLISTPFYTHSDRWQHLKLYNYTTKEYYLPAAPANQYLQPDDLKFFQYKRHQRFLSLPWKGTVIGTATDNYPLCTKSGTISFNKDMYCQFMQADCQGKYRMASNLVIQYVYSHPFTSPYYTFIDQSKEGLTLYKVE